MSLFGNIVSKIFGHPAAAKTPAAPVAAPAPVQAQAAPHAAPAATPAPAASQPEVDVEAVLINMQAAKGGPELNWRTSIVDLLKLLDLDSSLSARKELAQELGVHAAADGTPEQNIALQKAVMSKLAENGGKVPASLKD